MDDNYSDFLKRLEKFSDEYQGDLREHVSRLQGAHTELLAKIGLPSAADGFLELEDTLNGMKGLFDLGNKIRTIRKSKHKLDKEMLNLSRTSVHHGQEEEEAIDRACDQVMSILDEITHVLGAAERNIVDEVISRMNLIQQCQFGQAENRTKNALEFQRNVVQLLAWLFVDEIKLIKKDDMQEQLHLIRDAVFEISEGFDFERRGVDRIKFSHIIVECKNYRKPSYHDLMQVYAYTLLTKIFPTINKPLCLIVSRENPSTDSVTLKMRDKLFEKYGDRSLLIVFLSCKDLDDMVRSRKSSGDPFLVITNRIKEIYRTNILIES